MFCNICCGSNYKQQAMFANFSRNLLPKICCKRANICQIKEKQDLTNIYAYNFRFNISHLRCSIENFHWIKFDSLKLKKKTLQFVVWFDSKRFFRLSLWWIIPKRSRFAFRARTKTKCVIMLKRFSEIWFRRAWHMHRLTLWQQCN